MIDDALLDAEEKMEKAVNVAKEDMGSIRTGRANPAMFNKVVIEYYGAMTPVTQVASTSRAGEAVRGSTMWCQSAHTRRLLAEAQIAPPATDTTPIAFVVSSGCSSATRSPRERGDITMSPPASTTKSSTWPPTISATRSIASASPRDRPMPPAPLPASPPAPRWKRPESSFCRRR